MTELGTLPQSTRNDRQKYVVQEDNSASFATE
jgi:hypothetical protein